MKYYIAIVIVCLFSVGNITAQTDTLKTAPLRDDSSLNRMSLKTNSFTYAGVKRCVVDGSIPNEKTTIKPVPAAIVGTVYIGTLVALHYNQKNAWWKEQRGNFHFQEDWNSALQVDKFGHAFGGYIMAYASSSSLLASGFSAEDADLYGAIMGAAYQTYVEIEDGFGGQWGFSPSDWYFDVFGAGFFAAQHYIPFLQNITPKWGYFPSEWTSKPKIDRPRTFIDDYNSSTFWYSIDVHNMLGDKNGNFWPEWLNLGFGYGGDAIDFKKDPNGPPDQLSVRRYIVGLDYNLLRLLPEGGAFWNWFRQTLNYIKLPAPAMEFSKSGTRFYLLYPLTLKIGNIKF